MIRKFKIENYKSIKRLELNLGRVNVFIGENGSGKSNVLEAIALAAAAEGNKLDNEFLTSRGIRVTNPRLMRSGFNASDSELPVSLTVSLDGDSEYNYRLTNDNKVYSEWEQERGITSRLSEAGPGLSKLLESLPDDEQRREVLEKLAAALGVALKNHNEQKNKSKGKPREITVNVEMESKYIPTFDSVIAGFVIYSPENSSLRTFEREGQVQPLGVNGEGLLKLLSVMYKSRNKREIDEVTSALKLLSWFDGLSVTGTGPRARINIVDRYLDAEKNTFDQRSANEGFLFVTFYLALMVSTLTPKFFAIDNIDASLNPKLCKKLMSIMPKLAVENGKQVLLTTHNPAVLDGIDLSDDEQRLFVVSRNRKGETQVRRIDHKPSMPTRHKLSEMFISGVLGGLPNRF
ncbi:MAG: AAA family ATPase [Brevundimonas sp.]|uniref:AAA family ATPase n=1 Tax=Brevundimonas sp. TaxID=1871086 RepID=UPI00391A20A1